MNLALSTLIILILLAPGFVYMIAYHSTRLSIKSRDRVLLNELIKSIGPAILIQSFGIWLVSPLYKTSIETIGSLLLGDLSFNQTQEVFKQIEEFWTPIISYQILIFVLAYLLGHLGRETIRYFRIDRKYRQFRFNNKWHYIFSGECLDFPDVPDDQEQISMISVDVLCKVNAKTVIYTGQLFNYYIDNKGELNAIHLKIPKRRALEDDDRQTNRYHQIRGRFLVIPSESIININIRYFSIELLPDNFSEQEVDSVQNEHEIRPS